MIGWTWVDWACFLWLMAMGLWKTIELINKYAPMLANKIINWVEKK